MMLWIDKGAAIIVLYMQGTVLGNDKDKVLSDIISYYPGALYAVKNPDKVDIPKDFVGGGSLSDGDLTITWGDDQKSGT